MFDGYEKVRIAVDSLIIGCEQRIRDLDPEDEYEGILRMLLKSQVKAELVHRCGMLILEELPEDDLRELFTDEIWEEAAELFERMHDVWNKRHRTFS